MKKVKPVKFSEKGLREDIIRTARVTKMPEGEAEMIAERIAAAVAKWVKRREIITTDDLNRKVAEEARKYSPDVAYVYENRGKII